MTPCGNEGKPQEEQRNVEIWREASLLPPNFRIN